jgi:hypothetical protein
LPTLSNRARESRSPIRYTEVVDRGVNMSHACTQSSRNGPRKPQLLLLPGKKSFCGSRDTQRAFVVRRCFAFNSSLSGVGLRTEKSRGAAESVDRTVSEHRIRDKRVGKHLLKSQHVLRLVRIFLATLITNNLQRCFRGRPTREGICPPEGYSMSMPNIPLSVNCFVLAGNCPAMLGFTTHLCACVLFT